MIGNFNDSLSEPSLVASPPCEDSSKLFPCAEREEKGAGPRAFS